MITTEVNTAALQKILALLDPEELKKTDPELGYAYYTLLYKLNDKVNYAPMSFNGESCQASDKIRAWIKEKEDAGFLVEFSIGFPHGSERLSICWNAYSDGNNPWRKRKGSIDLSGRIFSYA